MSEYIAQGTVLAVDKTGAGTYTTLAQIVSFDGPSNTVGKIETTNLASERKTYRPGLPDPGELSFELQFDPGDATHIYLRGLADTPNQPVLSWKVTYPDAAVTSDVFDGFLTEFHPEGGGPEELITASATIAVTSAITSAPATPPG